MRILLTILFIAIGLSMIAFPIYYGYNEPIEAVILPEPIPTISELTIEPTTTPEIVAYEFKFIIVEPTPTPRPTPKPVIIYSKPAFCVECTDYMDYHISYHLSSGEYFNVRTCWNSTMLQNKSQVEEFMAWDTIDEVKFNKVSFSCGHYSQHIQNTASDNSIKCGVVAMQYSNNLWHSLVAFPTVDDGIVFVDPMMDDLWATVVIGERYETHWMAHMDKYPFPHEPIYPVVQWYDIYY